MQHQCVNNETGSHFKSNRPEELYLKKKTTQNIFLKKPKTIHQVIESRGFQGRGGGLIPGGGGPRTAKQAGEQMSPYHCHFDLFSRVIKQLTSHSRGRRPHAWRWHSHWRSSTGRHSHWWTHWGPHARRRSHHTCREDSQTAHDNKSHNWTFSKKD